MTAEGQFSIKAYSIKELIALYGVTYTTFRSWLTKVSDLGDYAGKKYTPAQVQKIVDHLGEPF
jgi:hypothetical protein